MSSSMPIYGVKCAMILSIVAMQLRSHESIITSTCWVWSQTRRIYVIRHV